MCSRTAPFELIYNEFKKPGGCGGGGGRGEGAGGDAVATFFYISIFSYSQIDLKHNIPSLHL